MWERWNPADARREVTLPVGQPVTVWTEVTGLTGDVVTSTRHYLFPEGGEAASTVVLRFRSESELRSSLAAAGFAVERIYGGWGREPDGELIVAARR